VTVARVADGVGEHVAELPRAVVAQQHEPRVHRARHGRGEAAGAGTRSSPSRGSARSSRRPGRDPARQDDGGAGRPRVAKMPTRSPPGRSGAAPRRAARTRRRRPRRTRCRRARAPPARSRSRASGWRRPCRTCPSGSGAS
jgi:hypothetical protein